jgi:L-asparaginase II
MSNSPYKPIFEIKRGQTVESIHDGSVAVVDVYGNLLAWYGNPDAVTFLRSTAKPFQALPFLEHGGKAHYQLSPREVAIICASHSGTDEHVAVIRAIQAKAGVSESELLCGVHMPYDKSTAENMQQHHEQPTPNRHNCSGKHTGMLAFVKMEKNTGIEFPAGLDYIDPEHPVQKKILHTFAEMCDLPVDQIGLGVDGCSAPNFAAPLRNVALAFARLCDPERGRVSPPERCAACHLIASAMMFNSDMVAGPGRFDTRLMRVSGGSIVSKGGAEGFQGLGIMPGVLGPDSPAVGIALKIGDGDARGKARSAVSLEVLRQMDVLSHEALQELSSFGPRFSVHNWREIIVGEGYPAFNLQRS